MRWWPLVAEPLRLDSDWLRAHPLPLPDNDADKNERGRVLAIGGCALVPGGIQLTAEAALRAGAGKVRIATVERAALALGIAMPEVAVIALPEGQDGEIAGHDLPKMHKYDAIIAGPAMGSPDAAGLVVDQILSEADDKAVPIFDAAALMALSIRKAAMRRLPVTAILTPHVGELAAMLEKGADQIEQNRPEETRRAAAEYQAVVVLKGPTSLVALPDGTLFSYAGGGVGLATGGSGDVLAGIAAGLAARGACPADATLWAVWLHGEAGRRCSEQLGPLGFLARELLAHIPGLMRGL